MEALDKDVNKTLDQLKARTWPQETFDEKYAARLLQRGRVMRPEEATASRWVLRAVAVVGLCTVAAAGVKALHTFLLETEINGEQVDSSELSFDGDGRAELNLPLTGDGTAEVSSLTFSLEDDLPEGTEGPVGYSLESTTGKGELRVLLQRDLSSAVEPSDPSAILTEPMTPAAGSHRFLNGKNSVRVPFELHNGDIVLPVKVNGVTLRMGLDNGNLTDSLFFHGSERIDAVDLKSSGPETTTGGGEGSTLCR